MLWYLFHYLLAAVLVFQGLHALGEQTSPMGVVPAEVRIDPGRAGLWGGFLVTFGALMAVTALLSHCEPWFAGGLGPMRTLGFVALALYGLWLVFGRRVDYTPVPPAR